MQRSEPTLRKTAPPSSSERARPPSITPLFPLILLETLRDRDRPEEVLEDEDLSVSLPRRLGLSDVVGVQIRRFQEEVKNKRLQSTPQMIDLMRLVVRRPDAEEIFTEAGRRIAHHNWQQRTSTMRGVLRVMPNPIPRIAARRAARRMFRQIAGDSQLSVGRWPVDVRMRNSLSARVDPNGSACALYAGAFAEIMQLHTGKSYRVLHTECAARGAEACQWTVEVAG
jgi:predicted hydrocarbon binding protein